VNTLPPALEHREFADIDRHFAKFIAGFGGGELPAIAAAALSRNIRAGHICLDLAEGPAQSGEAIPGLTWPGQDALARALKKNRATGGPDDGRPLVLDDAGRLYLRRYWEYEKSLAAAILARCAGNAPGPATTGDLQQLAIETALARRFVVISGGPGTGKTTTVLKILERMAGAPGGEHLRIALAAPTGKAAARMEESLLTGDKAFHDRLPKSASTIHRLLGSRPGFSTFRHDARNPLPVDVVVVDEASMVPLTLMAKLFDALPDKARVILLGDRHQLASVEPGYVLSDIAEAAGDAGSPLHGSLVTLEKNYRFGNESGIFRLSGAVREGDAGQVLEILNGGDTAGLVVAKTPSAAHLAEKLRPRILEGFSPYLRAGDPADALKRFQQFRVLCALRSGPYGVVNLNRTIGEILQGAGLIDDARLYAGLPVLITQNDYELKLFNGDVGILFPDAADVLMAWFPDGEGGVRHVAPMRLPVWEPAFAMTVHKSQGSEYDNVLLILPDRGSPVVTRELVYTGLTRAREGVEVWFQEAALREAVTRQVKRSSGLRERLGG